MDTCKERNQTVIGLDGRFNALLIGSIPSGIMRVLDINCRFEGCATVYTPTYARYSSENKCIKMN
jgi:hypothetical protein